MACAISGVIILKKPRHVGDFVRIESKLRSIICRAEERGRDSFGVSVFYQGGNVFHFKELGKASEAKWPLGFINRDTICAIANNRAEPTTEWVRTKGKVDIQPFCDETETVFVTHNGTIANDAQLRKQVKFEKPKTKIDTQSVCEYLMKKWDGRSRDGLREILMNQVVGSFAFAIFDKRQPHLVTLAANYKPLYVLFDTELECFFFSSFPRYLESELIPIYDRMPIEQCGPYMIWQFDVLSRHIGKVSLYPTVRQKNKRKVLVICSGGLDSVVVATKYVREGNVVTLLHFKYKCRAEKKEADAIQAVAKYLGCAYKFCELGDVFKNVIGHSRLTESGSPLVTEREGEASAELAWEWVPARNLIFYSLAVGIAEAHGFDIVALGNNLEESGAYPDNEAIFTEEFSRCVPYAVNLGNRVQVEMPVGSLMKREIIKLGLELDAPLDLAWSCYEAGEKPCGTCGPCYMRMVGFSMNGVKDPYEYEHDRPELWSDCRPYKAKVSGVQAREE
jgi:7-cyano-7-deazaguanine synthase